VASLDHVTISAVDFPRSLAFYDAALGALGLVRLRELVDEEDDDPAVEAAAWGPTGAAPSVWLVAASTPTQRSHLALSAGSRVEVETFFAAAVASGGRPHSAPRRWPIYRRGEFNAIVADPDGNLLEAVCPE
jgi:catechol 2,3-dioxygenase-like lactoylglutathione lyase family enzyme